MAAKTPNDASPPLKLTRAESAALVAVADLGLGAIEEFNLVAATGTTVRSIEKLRRGGETQLTRTEALALLNAIHKGFGAARRFGLAIDRQLARRAEAKLAALA